MTDVTALVLTLNEAPNIGRTLRRLTWAERVLVLDSGSTDGTLSIAADFPNVEIGHRHFDTHAAQWTYGLAQVRTRWTLALDADYVLSEALAGCLATLEPRADVAGYVGRFVYCIGGRPLRGTLYPAKPVLFQTHRGRFQQDGHTQRLTINGPLQDLQGVIYHDDRKPRPRWLANQTAYAAQEAAKLLDTPPEQLGRIDRIRRAGLAPLLTPAYCLLVKRLALDGRAGLTYTYERTYAELLLALQLLDCRLTGDHG